MGALLHLSRLPVDNLLHTRVVTSDGHKGRVVAVGKREDSTVMIIWSDGEASILPHSSCDYEIAPREEGCARD